MSRVLSSDLQTITPRLYVHWMTERLGGTSAYHLLSTHGREFERKPLPKDLWAQPPQECFRNAFVDAVKHPRKYFYCEGIANWLIPTEHAWLCDADGNCYDQTWDPDDRRKDQPKLYFGVVFELSYVAKVVRRTENYGVLWNPRDRGRLIMGKDKIKDALNWRFHQCQR